jgi:hypothetical protein
MEEDGLVLKLIVGFLSNNGLKTVVGAQESEEIAIENGVPQWAVLSVKLVLITICRYLTF